MPNLTGDPNQPVNVTIRALEPTDQAIPDLWNVPFQQFLNNDANLNQRMSSLETSQGGTTLAAHRSTSVLDHPDGSVTTTKIADGAVTLPKLASTAISTDPTPNTLALRNAQGAVQDGASIGIFKVLRVSGIYGFGGTRWFRLATWSGFSGFYRGIFADLRVRSMSGVSSGTLRFRTVPGTSPNPFISVSNNTIYTMIHNAIVRETSDGVYELWIHCSGDIYVEGVLGTITGNIALTPYGDVPDTRDTAPAREPGRFYLEWSLADRNQVFAGPGHIVSASRGTTSGYIRYDNGIQVCWATIIIGSGSWTYPAAFASTPQVLATAETPGSPRLVTITSVSTTAAGVLRTDLSGLISSGTVHLWAIGLWK